MQGLDPDTPFQICEFEGTLEDKRTAILFLRQVFARRWPKVQKINLFAGSLNERAESEYSTFGWVDPDAETSFAASVLTDPPVAVGRAPRVDSGNANM
jgi:hypothetical protein